MRIQIHAHKSVAQKRILLLDYNMLGLHIFKTSAYEVGWQVCPPCCCSSPNNSQNISGILLYDTGSRAALRAALFGQHARLRDESRTTVLAHRQPLPLCLLVLTCKRVLKCKLIFNYAK